MSIITGRDWRIGTSERDITDKNCSTIYTKTRVERREEFMPFLRTSALKRNENSLVKGFSFACQVHFQRLKDSEFYIISTWL